MTDQILVVEDDPEATQQLAAILGEIGEVWVEHDLGGALEAALELEPDLVILDLRLPAAQVLGLLRNLRTPAAGYLPVLVVTPEGARPTRDTALLFGACDFLNLPLDRTEVVVRARNMLLTRRLYMDLTGLTEGE